MAGSSSTIIATNGHFLFWRPRRHSKVPNPRPTYTVQSGTLPSGLHYDTDSGRFQVAQLYGTPSDTPGSFTPIVLRASANGVTQDHTLTITLVDPFNIATTVPFTGRILYTNNGVDTWNQAAAEHLAASFNILCGIPGRFTAQLESGGPTPTSGDFFIGNTPQAGYELPDGPDVYKGGPNPNRFVVKTVGGNTTLIRGGTGRATFAGVCWFLERYFGFWHDKTAVTLAGSHIFSPGVAGLTRQKPPAAAPLSMPITCPQVEERIEYVYIQEMRGSVGAETDDSMNKLGTSKRDVEFGVSRDYFGGGQHQPGTLIQLPAGSGGHATQGAYWKTAGGTGLKLKNPGTTGITGTFQVGETVQILRLAVPIDTATVTWPAKGDDYGIFLHGRGNSATIQTDDTLLGLTSGATCTIQGAWLTSLRPDWVLPNLGGGDPYDLSLRYVDINLTYGFLLAKHLCYSAGRASSGGGSFGLVLAQIVVNAWASLTEAQRNLRVASLGNTQDAAGGQCLCSRCAAVYLAATWTDDYGTDHGPESETMVVMGNQWIAAQRAVSGYASTWINLMAYQSPVQEAPTTAVSAGVSVLIVRIGGNIFADWWDDSSPDGLQFQINARRWILKCAAGMVFVWDYAQFYGENSLKPMPTEGVLHGIRLAEESGVRSFHTQGQNVVGGSRDVLLWKVRAMLAREKQYTVRDAVRICATRSYGAAGDMVFDAWCLFEDACRNAAGFPVASGHIFTLMANLYAAGVYSADILASLRTLYASALTAASGDSELTTDVKEFFGIQIASLGFCFQDDSTLGGVGAITIAAHPTDGARPNVFFRNLGDGAIFTYDDALLAQQNYRGTSNSEFSNGGEAQAELTSNSMGDDWVISRDDVILHIPVHQSGLRIWWLKVQGQTVIPFPVYADQYEKTFVARGQSDIGGVVYWGGSPAASLRGFQLAAGSRANSGQGGGDNGGVFVTGDSTSCEHYTFIGMGSSSGPNPDGKHFAQISVGAKAAGVQVITIDYLMQLQGDVDAQSFTAPEVVTSYPGAATLAKDDVDKFTVTNLPGLTGVTVEDRYTLLGNAVHSMYVETDPYTVTSRKKATICFTNAFVMTTSKTRWCRRTITISGL